jgi:hypothetical protein
MKHFGEFLRNQTDPMFFVTSEIAANWTPFRTY